MTDMDKIVTSLEVINKYIELGLNLSKYNKLASNFFNIWNDEDFDFDYKIASNCLINQNKSDEKDDYIKLAQIYNILKNGFKAEYLTNGNKKTCIEAIMDNNFNVNYKLPSGSLICQNMPKYIGNTVSHFFVEFCDPLVDTFDILIERGVDLTVQNNNGYTPLLLAFIRDKNISRILYCYLAIKNFKNYSSKIGISHFHVACSTNLVKVIDAYIKAGVPIDVRINDDAPGFAGYTPLHTAVEHAAEKAIEFLLNNGANLNSKDTKGMTPLHLYIRNLWEENIFKENQKENFKMSNNISDLPDDVGFNSTHLSCILGNFKSQKQNVDIDTPLNIDSPIFPGYTPLHFAAQLNFKTVILLLQAGANILAKDVNGTTPLDLCLKKFGKENLIQILLEEKQHQLSNLKFTNGVNLLDVLRAMKKYHKFKDCLDQKFKDVNVAIPCGSPVWAGCSLLHLTVIFNGPLQDILARPEANIACQDANNMTPLHVAFQMKKANYLLNVSVMYKRNLVNSVNQNNWSHLHIACAEMNSVAIELLLKNGADPNLSTIHDFQWQLTKDCNLINAGSTPLHIAVNIVCMGCSNYFLNELLQYGAKPQVADSKGITSYQIALKYQREKVFKQLLESDQDTNKEKIYKKLGWTKLQIACFIQDLSMLKQELESGAEVNKKITTDSPIWSGDAALHILYRKQFESRNEFIEQLLAHGADPCLQNAENSTPVHLSQGEIFQTSIHLLGNNFYSNNPVNNQGQSHFHVACLKNNLLVIENYLKSGIDINEAVDYFADSYAGYTPLHIAVKNNNVQLIKLLLTYSADPNVKSTDGYTPLHLAVLAGNEESLLTLISTPELDIQATNLLGDTALEMTLLMESKNYRFIEILLGRGAYLTFARLIIKRFNETLIFQMITKVTNTKIFRKFIANVPDLTISDDEGQNLIHYVSSGNINYINFKLVFDNIKVLIDSGCEIDHKNNKGKTPLHVAASSVNRKMFSVLMELGADISIKDDYKGAPYFYDSENRCNIGERMWSLEGIKFSIDRLETNKNDFIDTNMFDMVYEGHFANFWTLHKEKKDIDSWLKKEINPYFSTAYIGSEKFVRNYWRIPEFQRRNIYNACTSNDWQKHFPSLSYFIEIQLRRGRSRNRLIEPALDSIQILTGLTITEMCLEIIDYLDNDSLMNLIRVSKGQLEFSPLIEKW